jgi:hypothetical protein
MNNEKNYIESPALAEKITEKLHLLHQGNLSTNELEMLVEDARELYERLAVLKFLALKKDYNQESSSELLDSTDIDTTNNENFSLDTKASEDTTTEPSIETEVESEISLSFTFGAEEDSEVLNDEIKEDASIGSPEKEKEKIVESGAISENTYEEEFKALLKEEEEKQKHEVEEKLEESAPSVQPEIKNEDTEVVEPTESASETIDEDGVTLTKQEEFVQTIEVNHKLGGETLNEKYATRHVEKETIALKHEKGRIEDLKKAIGINKRFLFINELFKGKADEFNSSIDKLNQFEEAIEAYEFVQRELARKHQWDFESEAVAEFLELVERRFM